MDKPDLILTHADADGICSAALLLTVFPKTKVFFTKPVSLLKDLKFLKQKNLVLADLAFNKKDTKEIVKELQKRDFLYFDHHPIPDLPFPEGFELDTSASTSELIFKFFRDKLPEERSWVALYGAIGDYCEDTKFVKEMMKDWDIRSIYFEASTLVLGIKNDEFSSYDKKREIIQLLASGKNPSDFPGLVQSAKEAVKREFELYKTVKSKVKILDNLAYFVYDKYFGFRGPSALFAATAGKKDVGVSCFKRRDFLDITLRSKKPFPLHELAEKAAEVVGGSGGGHPGAAGARIPDGSFEKFLKALDKLLTLSSK